MTSTMGPLAWVYAPEQTATDLGISQDEFDNAVAVAVDWLWSMTGRQFGTRTIIMRPQSRSVDFSSAGFRGLQPFDGWPDWRGDGYGPEQHQYIELPGPVADVQTVQIEGAPVDPDIWRVEGNYLVRQDGDVWPDTQNLISPLGADDTWSVTYNRGMIVPPMGQYATGKLVAYLAKQIGSGQPCAVPYNTTSVSRGGVTIQRDVAKATITTGVKEVDQWLPIVNPNQLMAGPSIWSPDVERRRAPFAGSYQGSTVPIGIPVSAHAAGFVVLGATQDVPAGLPIGTVILRTQS